MYNDERVVGGESEREGATYLMINDVQRHPRVSRMHMLFTIDGAHVYVQAFLIRKVALVIR